MWRRLYVECQPAQTPPMAWASFSSLFMEKYIPRTLRDKRRDEFLSLEQGRMSVTTYEAKFRALSRYATQLCFSRQEWICHFVKGLRSDLQIPALQVATAAKSFQEVVYFGIALEGVKQDEFTMASYLTGSVREVSLVVLTLEGRVQEVTQPVLFSLHYRL